MLELAHGLTDPVLRALADLERRTVAVDGGRLKLEWGELTARSGSTVEDLLWWDGDRLLGFLGLYAFGGGEIELAGMVDPAARRRGIGSALLDAALPLCRARRPGDPLLIVPRSSTGGRALALGRGGVLDRSEYAMELVGPPDGGPHDPALRLRPADSADGPELSRLLAEAFGDPVARTGDPKEGTLVIELDGVTVGTVRVSREAGSADVYGFAVAPAYQGRGIGRNVLRVVCGQLQQEGARRIGLEVAVGNERALSLYTSVGFRPVTTEDYYALPAG